MTRVHNIYVKPELIDSFRRLCNVRHCIEFTNIGSQMVHEWLNEMVVKELARGSQIVILFYLSIEISMLITV